jgi:hypothetical protein
MHYHFARQSTAVHSSVFGMFDWQVGHCLLILYWLLRSLRLRLRSKLLSVSDLSCLRKPLTVRQLSVSQLGPRGALPAASVCRAVFAATLTLCGCN